MLRLLADQSRCRRTAIRRRHQEAPSGNQGICIGCSWAIMICLLQQRNDAIYMVLQFSTKRQSSFFFGNAKSALWPPDGGRQWPNVGEEEGPLCRVRWRWKGGSEEGDQGEAKRRGGGSVAFRGRG